MRFEKPIGDYSVAFDALVGSVGCRQTATEWSFAYLAERSSLESLEVAQDLEAWIPEPSLLFGLKSHSGRLADARDLVILGAHANWDAIRPHIERGDIDELSESIARIIGELEDGQFRDSFHGAFQQHESDDTDVDELLKFLRRLKDEL